MTGEATCVSFRGSSPCPAPLIVASFLPGEGCFESARFDVRAARCEGPFDYWQALADVWYSPATIVNLEHDLEVGDEHIAGLVECPAPLCAWSYLAHWASTGLAHDVIAAGTGDRNADRCYLRGGEEWAAWAAIGLVKITREARVASLRREPWNRLELAVADAVRGPWHMHGNGARPGDFSGHLTHHHF